MPSNEKIIREIYATAEGRGTDVEKLVSLFSEDGYMRDMTTGTEFRGDAICESIAGFISAFPDVHRELVNLFVAGDVVVVELKIQGTHTGELTLASGALAPTGKKIDVPCCDVFHLENGKVRSFHCYKVDAVMLQQLGVGLD
ncbi:MAG TPA: ester cyclase [Sphingobium sp.]